MCPRVTQPSLRAAVLLTSFMLVAPRALLAQTEAGAESAESRPSAGNEAGTSTSLTEAANSQALRAFGKLPVSFIENRGQVDERVRFHARRGGMTAYFTSDAFAFELVRREGTAEPSTREERSSSSQKSPCDEVITGASVFLFFEGASTDVLVEGIDLLHGRYNYFLGNDASRWCSNVPAYSSIRYRGLYPDIDLVVREQEGRIEYDVILEPGADLDRVAIRCEGAERLRIDERGALIVETAAGPIEQPRPHTYQISPSGERVPVDCSFRLLGEACFGFVVTGRLEDLPLVVDPGLVYSTFLGGSNDDSARALALDATGAAVITGITDSFDFPTTPGAYDSTFNRGQPTELCGGRACADIFVAKLDPSGSVLLFSTFLGGSGFDGAGALALDPTGAAVITGHTYSFDFPTTPGAYDRIFKGGGSYWSFLYSSDAFVAKLDPTGSSLVYSTFLGGRSADAILGVALDAAGAAIVTGGTSSPDFPTTPGAYDTTYNDDPFGADVFVSKLDASGRSLVYSTFLGGSDYEQVGALALDAAGAVVVDGRTRSSDFPTTPGAYDTTYSGGTFDAFVTKLDPAGSSLLYSTFLGGSANEDAATGIALDATGAAVLMGYTKSADFPTTPGAYDTMLNGQTDAFVAKLDPTGGSLLYSTFLGGSQSDEAHGLALDAAGTPIVSGYTLSSDFPTTPGSYDTTYNGAPGDAFVVKLKLSGDPLLYSTFLGGFRFEVGHELALDAKGAAVVSGSTKSSDFPTTPGAYDTIYGGGPFFGDGFVAKLDLCVAFARKYGSGWPGTLGVPALTTSGPPVLCTQSSISIGNSRGATTTALFVIGFGSASIPTAFGGTLVVLPSFVIPFTLPGAGASVPYSVLCGDEFCSLGLYLQVLEVDPGASQGVSFTEGLQLIHGH